MENHDHESHDHYSPLDPEYWQQPKPIIAQEHSPTPYFPLSPSGQRPTAEPRPASHRMIHQDVLKQQLRNRVLDLDLLGLFKAQDPKPQSSSLPYQVFLNACYRVGIQFDPAEIEQILALFYDPAADAFYYESFCAFLHYSESEM